MGYIIAYTIKSGYEEETRYTDHTIILAEATEQEALEMYRQIIQENDTFVTEVYTACIGKIIDSTEPHHI